MDGWLGGWLRIAYSNQKSFQAIILGDWELKQARKKERKEELAQMVENVTKDSRVWSPIHKATLANSEIFT